MKKDASGGEKVQDVPPMPLVEHLRTDGSVRRFERLTERIDNDVDALPLQYQRWFQAALLAQVETRKVLSCIARWRVAYQRLGLRMCGQDTLNRIARSLESERPLRALPIRRFGVAEASRNTWDLD